MVWPSVNSEAIMPDAETYSSAGPSPRGSSPLKAQSPG